MQEHLYLISAQSRSRQAPVLSGRRKKPARDCPETKDQGSISINSKTRADIPIKSKARDPSNRKARRNVPNTRKAVEGALVPRAWWPREHRVDVHVTSLQIPEKLRQVETHTHTQPPKTRVGRFPHTEIKTSNNFHVVYLRQKMHTEFCPVMFKRWPPGAPSAEATQHPTPHIAK